MNNNNATYLDENFSVECIEYAFAKCKENAKKHKCIFENYVIFLHIKENNIFKVYAVEMSKQDFLKYGVINNNKVGMFRYCDNSVRLHIRSITKKQIINDNTIDKMLIYGDSEPVKKVGENVGNVLENLYKYIMKNYENRIVVNDNNLYSTDLQGCDYIEKFDGCLYSKECKNENGDFIKF